MGWIFWTLVILGILLLIAPLLGLLSAAVAAVLWLLGGVLLIGAVIWALVIISRAPTATPPTMEP